MNLFESLRVSIRGLANNKLRSALTMLGIIIGVGVVIMVVAIGEGATQRVTETVNSLGTNLLTIFPGSQRIRITAATAAGGSGQKNGSSGGGGGGGITLLEAEMFGKNFPKTVEAVAPSVRDNAQIRLGNRDSSTNITGATVEYPYVKSVETDRGRFFTEEEVDGSQKVCVAGTTVADKLLGNPKADLTGQTISINRLNFKVVGMQARAGVSGERTVIRIKDGFKQAHGESTGSRVTGRAMHDALEVLNGDALQREGDIVVAKPLQFVTPENLAGRQVEANQMAL